MADISKQSYEEFRIHADFGLNMEDGEALVVGSCSVVCEDKAGEDVTSTLLDIATMAVINADATDADPPGSGVENGALQVLIRAGSEALSQYKFTFYGVTDLTPPNKWEKDITLKIKER
jgi:hypothetical protein